MSNQLNWTEQFKISEATLATWKSQQAKSLIADQSPLFWGLVNGQLPELEYYNWAQEKFELPFVRTDYFAIPVDPIFWAAVKDLHSWSASLYPLALWDGVLLIGCVEPPKNFAYPRPYRFILASARHLQMHWANLNPELHNAKTVREVAKVTDPDPLPSRKVNLDLPDGFNMAPGGTQTGVVDMHTFPDGVAHDSLDVAKVDISRADGIGTVSMNDVDLSIPDGFEADNGDLGGVDEAADAYNQAAKARAEHVEEDQVEDNSDFQAAEDVVAQPAHEPEPAEQYEDAAAEFASSEPEPEQIHASAHIETPLEEMAAEAEAIGGEIPHEEFGSHAEPHELTASAVTASAVTASAVIEPTMTFTGTNSPDINWVVPVDPMSLDRTQSLDDLALHTLSAVSRQFNGALIFLRSTAGYKPWKFTAPFRTPKKDFGPLDLAAPSIFRIVDRTHLPYHGYIESSPENDRFFKAFLGGLAPAHITVTPIMHQKICIGFIVGINDNAIPYKHILPLLDGLASQFAINYKRLDSTMSAVA